MTETILGQFQADSHSPVPPGTAVEEQSIDEELLEEAMRGTGVPRNETINILVRAYVMEKRKLRREALEELRRMSDEGLFDYSRLDEIDR